MIKHKPFSQRLIEDLTPILSSSLLVNGMRLDSIEMNPIEDDEEIESIFGDEFVFTIKATAYMCRPKGRMQKDIPTENRDQQ